MQRAYDFFYIFETKLSAQFLFWNFTFHFPKFCFIFLFKKFSFWNIFCKKKSSTFLFINCHPNTFLPFRFAIFSLFYWFVGSQLCVVDYQKSAHLDNWKILLESTEIYGSHFSPLSIWTIEEVWWQKARQNVGVFDWGARSNATLEIFGVIV